MTILFTLKIKYRDAPWKEHAIEHWPGYGVVCPSMATTNGSYRFMVHVIRSYAGSSDYTLEVVPSAIAPASLAEWDLLDPIREWLDDHEPLRSGPRPTLGMSSWS